MRPRIFISHASEDKQDVARPLAQSLRHRGFHVWFDEFVLHVGDPLLESIDRGLSECDFGVVILSKSFFARKWPQRELSGLVAREDGDTPPQILPIWHEMTLSEVAGYSPVLAARLAASTSEGVDNLVDQIVRAVRAHGGLGEKSLDVDFLVSFEISGRHLFDLVKSVLEKQHHVSSDEDGERLTLTLYEDGDGGGGLDVHESGYMVADGVARSVQEEDLLSILSEQPYVPRGYRVRHLKFDFGWLGYDKRFNGAPVIDVRDVERVQFTAIVEQQFVNSDELIPFVAALSRFSVDSDPAALSLAPDSPGRIAVRRLLEVGRFGEIEQLIQSKENRILEAIGPAIALEMKQLPPGDSGRDLVRFFVSASSSLHDVWKERLNALLES